MGCRTSKSKISAKEQFSAMEAQDLKLFSSKLVFTAKQLLKLNEKFSSFLECNNNMRKPKEKQTACIDVVVERLVQRLICNVGNLDSRFSSKFLINLRSQNNYECVSRARPKYKYLVRLDLISTPALYPEFFEPPVRIIEGFDNESLPLGFAKVRVHGEFLEQWEGFISPSGFLRRDKIQERFVELLARAAARSSEPLSPDQVDESRLCGSPGKLVDPITLHHILNTPPFHQVYFGSAECNESRFPDPRDFRIAIVEGIPETRLHISFLSPTAQSMTTEDVEISLMIGVGVSGWPQGSNFPWRLPLDHVDVILGYKAAQMDYYLVPKGPHSSIHCEDKCSVWEIRSLATELYLEHHYSPMSVVVRIYKILIYLSEVLKARGVKVINKYILKTLLFYELENKKKIQQWTPRMISRRVLSMLDRLLLSLRNQFLPNYFFPRKNLLLLDGILEEDFDSDGDILEHYIKQLFYDDFKMDVSENDHFSGKDQLENVMLQKWENVITTMMPSMSNRSRRLSVINNSPASISYTKQQMEYVALLLKEILNVKRIQGGNFIREVNKFSNDMEETNKEDFIYLLQIMFDQAKQKALSTNFKKFGKKKEFKLDQLILSYDISTALLIDDIRRSRREEFNFVDDMSLVVKIMGCLYKAIDSDGRVLGPVLRPYLNQIFKGSHENCWFLYEWKKKTDLSEFQAIGAFSSLVLTGNINPLDGILNSVSKGWNWASVTLQIMHSITEENSTRIIIGEKIDSDNSGLRLIFTPRPGKTVRFNVSSTKTDKKVESLMKNSNNATTERNGSGSRFATIKSFQDVLDSAISIEQVHKNQSIGKNQDPVPYKNVKFRGQRQPPHVQLRDGNPFTVASMEVRRQGNHRGLGSIVQALISLQKLSVLQEISEYLPERERTKVLSDIKKLSKEIQRLTVDNFRKKKNFSLAAGKTRFSFKKKSNKTLPVRLTNEKLLKEEHSRKFKYSDFDGSGVYRNTNEFSICNEETLDQTETKEKRLNEKVKEESLLGTCRQLRRENTANTLESNTVCTRPKTGRYKKQTSTFPKAVINTPFYIKVSSYNNKFSEFDCSHL